MTIKMLKDYTVGTPPEAFRAGAVLKDRAPASEEHFVRRGVAAYMAADGTLTDYEGNVIGRSPPRAKASAKPAAKPKPKPKAAKVKTAPPVPRAETRAPPTTAIGAADIRLPPGGQG